MFDAFVKTSDDAKKLGINDTNGFLRSYEDLAAEANQIQVPGETKGNYHHPRTSENVAKYIQLMAQINNRKNKLDGIRNTCVNEYLSKTLGEATDVKTFLDTNRDWFSPITVKIMALWATATDSKGVKYDIQIVKPQQ